MLHDRGMKFESLPPELDGFRMTTRVGPVVRPNFIEPRGQRDHHVYFRNRGPAEVDTAVIGQVKSPRLSYVHDNNREEDFWEVDVESVPSGGEPERAATLRHDAISCSNGNQHTVTLEAIFQSRLPGSPVFAGELRLELRCN